MALETVVYAGVRLGSNLDITYRSRRSKYLITYTRTYIFY